MENSEFISKLKSIVNPYVQDKDALTNISEETDFIKDLKINSANLIDVILDVEQEFNIEIDDDSIGKMISVKSAIDVIKSKMNSR